MHMFLHVRVTVANDNLELFYQKMAAFLATKFLEDERLGWKLLGGFEIVKEKYPKVGPDRRPPVHAGPHETAFINLWSLSLETNALDLAEIMGELSEQPQYVALDSSVLDESQDVTFQVIPAQVSDIGEITKRLAKCKQFAFVRQYIARQKLAGFVFNFGALAPSWARSAEYFYAGTYQNITGLLNEFWSVWGTPEASLDQIQSKFNALSEEAGLVQDEYRRSIEFKDGDPDDGIVLVRRARYWALPE